MWHKDFRFWAEVAQLLSLAVIASVQRLEHGRSRVPNGVVLFFWLFFIAVYLIKLRSLLSQQIHIQHLAYFVTATTATGLAVLEFLLECFATQRQGLYEELEDGKQCPYEYASVFSVLFFAWM